MLLNIHPLLSGELLLHLDMMGHGDQLVVADRNFPSHSHGATVVSIAHDSAAEVIAAILTVFPLDGHVENPLERMGPADGTLTPNDQQASVLKTARDAGYSNLDFGVVPRFAFYERATAAVLIVQTLEAAPYCDFILTKGVV